MAKNSYNKLPLVVCVFFISSVIGWIFEVPLRTYIAGFLVLPGFLYGCYLPIYGVGALLVVFFFEKWIDKRIKILKINVMPLIIFMCCVIILGAMEYMASVLLEKLFDLELWNYAHHRFNINGRISLEQSSVFGLAGTTFIYIIYPKLKKFLLKRGTDVLSVEAAIITIVMVTDFVISVFKYLS